MPKTQKHADLPTKTCLTCQRPFRWRKRWRRCWADVLYCSDRCRAQRPRPQPQPRDLAPDLPPSPG